MDEINDMIDDNPIEEEEEEEEEESDGGGDDDDDQQARPVKKRKIGKFFLFHYFKENCSMTFVFVSKISTFPFLFFIGILI